MISENTLTIEEHGLALSRGDSDFRFGGRSRHQRLYRSGRDDAVLQGIIPRRHSRIAMKSLWLLGPEMP